MSYTEKGGPTEPAVLLNNFLKHESVLTPQFIESLDLKNMGPLDPNERRAVGIKEAVENTVDLGYYPELAATATGRDPYASAFMKKWRAEEKVHGDTLGDVLTFTAPTSGESPVIKTIPYKPTSPYWYALLGDKVTVALHMTWGAINETVTHFVYKMLAEKTRNETFRKLLHGILREEARHMTFYRGMSRWYLHNYHRARIIVPHIIRLKWKGVGADVIYKEDSDFLSRYVMSGNEDLFKLRAGDALRKLPGMNKFMGDQFLLKNAGLAFG